MPSLFCFAVTPTQGHPSRGGRFISEKTDTRGQVSLHPYYYYVYRRGGLSTRPESLGN